MSKSVTRNPASGPLLRRLVLLVVGMFGFGYALVPLYGVFCELTGFGGRTGVVEADALDGAVDRSRVITVQFVGNVDRGLPWEFRPVRHTMRVHPGEVYEVRYFARNRGEREFVGQAVPSVSPAVASRYFNKTECFCFTRQRFDAGEGREMPVRFVIDTSLPSEYSTLTLGYTFFRVGEQG